MSRITAGFPPSQDVLLGPGDDAAIVRADDGRVVVSTDLLVEGRHFRRDWSSGYDVGRKAAAQNLADIAAMGARPTSLVVGLGVPAELPVDWLDGLIGGFRDECVLVRTTVAGGDVTRSDLVVIGVTALGSLDGRDPVRRSGARPGQVVAVTGRLGYAAAGLALLEAGWSAESRPGGLARARSLKEAVEGHRRPRPPYARGPEAALLGAVAMLDVSDGLVQDLGHVAAASGVGITLDPETFTVGEPVAAAADELGGDPLDWVLTGGDDHALAAVFPAEVRLPPEWTAVGTVTEGDGVTVQGRRSGPGGWDHFR